MEDQIHNIDFFDRTMHDIDNNFTNVLHEADPDLQMRMNIPECQIFSGHELHLHSN